MAATAEHGVSLTGRQSSSGHYGKGHHIKRFYVFNCFSLSNVLTDVLVCIFPEEIPHNNMSSTVLIGSPYYTDFNCTSFNCLSIIFHYNKNSIRQAFLPVVWYHEKPWSIAMPSDTRLRQRYQPLCKMKKHIGLCLNACCVKPRNNNGIILQGVVINN